MEELGVKLNDTARQIMNLLRLESDEYTMKASSIATSKVVAVISKIRNIRWKIKIVWFIWKLYYFNNYKILFFE